MDTQLPISVIVLTLNEKERMRRCLESLGFAAQVVVMDSFSNDGTLEECARLWKEWNRSPESLVLIEQEWLGFEKTRNLSKNFAAFDWILWVDADEWISSELLTELQGFFKNQASQPDVQVYRMPRLTYFLGRPIYHGGWYPDRKRRLGHRKFSEWRRGPHGADVHEDLYSLQNAQVGDLQGHLYHETFRNIQEQEETNRRYSTLLAEGLAKTYQEQRRSAPSMFYVYAKVVVKFFENYFLKLGLLDAYPGFLIAKGSAKSLLMRYKKLIELLSQNSKAKA